MPELLEVKRKIPKRRRPPSATKLPPLPKQPRPKLSRQARLLALAYLFEDMLHRGEVQSMAELARICRVSRARVSQIMGLLNLDPERQLRQLVPHVLADLDILRKQS